MKSTDCNLVTIGVGGMGGIDEKLGKFYLLNILI